MVVKVHRGIEKLQNNVLTTEGSPLFSGFRKSHGKRQLDLQLTTVSRRENYAGIWRRKYAKGKHSCAYGQKFISRREFR